MDIRSKVIVITREGHQITLDAWQKIYGLPAGSLQIGRYFSLEERRFALDVDLYGRLVVNELLIRFLDGLRIAWGKAISINSFNRDEAKQRSLTAGGFRTAASSPHVVKEECCVITGAHPTQEESVITGGTAADVDTTSDDETYKLVKVARQVADILQINVRIGYKDYMRKDHTFVHFDVCPEYYAPGKPWHDEPHPAPWEKVIEW